MRKFRVSCNSIVTRERFERALQAQGFKPYADKQEFDRFKLLRIHPGDIVYYIVWEDNVYTIDSVSTYFVNFVASIDRIDGRQVTSKAKWLRQQIDKLKEGQYI